MTFGKYSGHNAILFTKFLVSSLLRDDPRFFPAGHLQNSLDTNNVSRLWVDRIGKMIMIVLIVLLQLSM